MTWPLVVLRVSKSSYEDIKRRIIAAGQPDRIFDDGRISVDEVAIEIDPADVDDDSDMLDHRDDGNDDGRLREDVSPRTEV